MRIIDTLENNNYTIDNAQPVADAIALLKRLDVDEDGAFYFRSVDE
tara:strand:- start:317 stop:454 length:138 start_codon:yes stop_codon:yes gene_type:complete